MIHEMQALIAQSDRDWAVPAHEWQEQRHLGGRQIDNSPTFVLGYIFKMTPNGYL